MSKIHKSKMPRPQKVMKVDEMKKLLSKDAETIIQDLNNTGKGFENFLRKRDYSGKDVEIAMQLIVKACTSKKEGSVRKLLSHLILYRATFLEADVDNIINDILERDCQINPSNFLQNYMTILKHLLKKTEQVDFVSDALPKLENYINDLSNTNKYVQNLRSELMEICEEIRRQSQQVEEPNEDFRTMSIFPKAADMVNNNPFLQPNKIEGAYKTVDQYLNIQFRLMREDMVRSFRASIAEIRTRNVCTFRSSERKQPEVAALIKKIKLSDRPTYRIDGVHFALSFDYGTSMPKNNPFIPGSIVCLSSDNFVESFIFATIKSQELKNKVCSISVVVETDNDNEMLLDKKYELIVTNAYFESYRNVLSALQQLNDVNFPLSDYIVKLDSSNSKPYYENKNYDLNEDHPEKTEFCLHELCNSTSNYDHNEDHPCRLFDVFDKEDWPTEKELKLDAHQLFAFQAALTQRLAIIQGPPGTGKTFLGIKIVKALLENAADKKPIILCCQTNHALDQFLNHMLSHTQKVLRIGSQSKDENMRRRSLVELGVAIWEYRNIKSLDLDLDDDDLKDSLDIVRNFIPDIDDWVPPKVQQDYVENELRDLCPVLNAMLEKYLMLKFKYMEPDALLSYLPKSVLTAHEKDPNQSVKSVKHFIATWLDIDNINDVYVRCKNSWEGFNIDSFPVDCKQIESFAAGKSIWAISVDKRYHHLYYWRKLAMKILESDIQEGRERYFNYLNMLKSSRQMNRFNPSWLELLKAADIVGVTMTGAAKMKQLLQLLKPQIMIVEEAAETLESNIISSLVPTIKQLILIGDHEQLRPIPADDELSKKYNLNISLFERLVKNNIPHATLTTQHRMRPCISDLLVPHIYKKLNCHPSVEAFESITGIQMDLFFFNHDELEDEKKGTSISNSFEATFIVKLASYLLSVGYESSKITILAMYNAQIVLIQRLLEKNDCTIRVTTVDNFQGEENDIILISLVRSNRYDTIGFLAESNRLCVALSRARKGLYCIGNFTMLARKSKFWSNVVSKVRRDGRIGRQFPIQCPCHKNKIPITSAADFDNILDTGCREMCGYKLPCEHYCPSPCHFKEIDHNSVKCLQPCNKIITIQRRNKTKTRQCKHLCYRPCEDSKSFIELSCGHRMATALNDTTGSSTEKCMVERSKTLICGHIDQVPCCVPVADHKCRALVPITLPCRHVKMLPCHQKEITGKVICNEQKSHISPCGHTVFVPCYITPSEDILLEYCKNSCSMLLKCGHPCQNICSWCCSIKIHSNCAAPCERKLYCGHTCLGYCGSPCIDCDLKCELGCDHITCRNPCGKPCVECKEKCSRKCPHQECSKLCYEECSVRPCQEPCEKKLECGHKCIGLCGDPCPPLCRICNSGNLKSSNVDDDHFVYLSESCGHVLEVERLTLCVKNSVNALPNCFQCGAIIVKCGRYKDDIIKCKKKFLDIENSRYRTLDIITYEFHTLCGLDNLLPYQFLDLKKKLEDILTDKPTTCQLIKLPSVIVCLRELYNWRIKTEGNDIAETRFEILVKWLYNNLETASYQQFQELKEAVKLLQYL